MNASFLQWLRKNGIRLKLLVKDLTGKSYTLHFISVPFFALRDFVRYKPYLPDRKYLEAMYQKRFGCQLDISRPKSFSEKLQWLKLYARTDLHSVCADKIAVKSHLKERVGSEYVIPTLFVAERPEDVNLASLPDAPVVVKTNHDHGTVFIIHDKHKFNCRRMHIALRKAMARNLYWAYREWGYQGITPKVLVEPFIGDDGFRPPKDYKLFCMNERVRLIMVNSDRFGRHAINFYSPSWEDLDVRRKGFPKTEPERRPSNLEKMIQIAQSVAQGFIFVRVDLYVFGGKIYVGELTFFPVGGKPLFDSAEFDVELGNLLELPCH